MDDYAVFVYCNVPVIAKLGSELYKKLLSMNKWCVTGTIDSCVNFADDVVAIVVSEMEA
jgi:hypothetical protein